MPGWCDQQPFFGPAFDVVPGVVVFASINRRDVVGLEKSGLAPVAVIGRIAKGHRQFGRELGRTIGPAGAIAVTANTPRTKPLAR